MARRKGEPSDAKGTNGHQRNLTRATSRRGDALDENKTPASGGSRKVGAGKTNPATNQRKPTGGNARANQGRKEGSSGATAADARRMERQPYQTPYTGTGKAWAGQQSL
ncbi:hypothetical protein K9N68_05835 [Kovacikia minuta CCNUW1]|uniref:hypothetical protein n=1 Tax=Kovacikia minuta TaxID=2931930 RepID=UPI001CCB9396|nr:hypothetical protein [Kovacikia minuta]UBF27465.1 hypothetical protein K9N68_05835 [Kovacikia minuta CCNUW1]